MKYRVGMQLCPDFYSLATTAAFSHILSVLFCDMVTLGTSALQRQRAYEDWPNLGLCWVASLMTSWTFAPHWSLLKHCD